MLQHFIVSSLKLFSRIFSEHTWNKTADYHWHIFCPPILFKIPFKRWKRFLENRSASANFNNFFKFKFFLISAKTSIQVVKKSSHDIKSFDTHSTANWPPFGKKNEVLSKIHRFFPKKTNQNFVRFEKSYYFSRFEVKVCYNLDLKKFHGQNHRTSDTFRTSDVFNWQKRKKVLNFSILCGWFSYYIKNVGRKQQKQLQYENGPPPPSSNYGNFLALAVKFSQTVEMGYKKSITYHFIHFDVRGPPETWFF